MLQLLRNFAKSLVSRLYNTTLPTESSSENLLNPSPSIMIVERLEVSEECGHAATSRPSVVNSREPALPIHNPVSIYWIRICKLLYSQHPIWIAHTEYDLVGPIIQPPFSIGDWSREQLSIVSAKRILDFISSDLAEMSPRGCWCDHTITIAVSADNNFTPIATPR